MDLLASIIKPDLEFRNLYYPNPEQHGNLTELDGLLAVDDLLFLVASKAGGLSAAANRGAPDSLVEDLLETIGKGQRQAERAEAYLRSADEVAFFDSSGSRELLRLKQSCYRFIFRIVVTREDLGSLGARLAIFSMLDKTLSKSYPWHVSFDDLRVVEELFKDRALQFSHYLENRLRASSVDGLVQHDEIEHIALYNKINAYHNLPVRGAGIFTFDASYMREIEYYFSSK